MTLFARFFHEDGMSFDLSITDLGTTMASVRVDGFVIGPGFYIPYERVSMVVTYEAEQKANVFSIVPNQDKPL